jgi:hypothetical protein
MLYVAIVLLLLSLFFSFYQKEGYESRNDILMVVARYNERLEWLKYEPFSKYKVLVYNKGINEDFYNPGEVETLPNVGREGHTYLYHIVKHYDNLNDITIFFPGSLNLHNKIEKGIKTVLEIEKTNKAVYVTDSKDISSLYDFTITNYASTSEENLSLNDESKLELARIRPFGEWSKSKFKNNSHTHYSNHGVLSVSKKDVYQRPKSFYEDLLEELSHTSSPEVGHYVERSWQPIFLMKDTLLL